MSSASDPATAVDLSRLPSPDVVEALSFETIFAEMIADLVLRDSTFTALVESDPSYKVLQVCAFREVLLRQRVNDAARRNMLAFAEEADLEHLGALLGVFRLTIDPGDEALGIAPTKESDPEFRRRITLAPEGYSCAGSEGAYVFHALSAHPQVKDASAYSPMPGVVIVTVLSRLGDGTADADILAAVTTKLSAKKVRPLTDNTSVQSATIDGFAIEAIIYTYEGPASNVVLAAALTQLNKYLEESRFLGRDITRIGIGAALKVPGVQNIDLISPAADIVLDRTQAASCTGINIVHGGIRE